MDRVLGPLEIGLILVFLYLLNHFSSLGGDKFPLLRIIVDLILVLFFMIIIGKIRRMKKVQKKIDDYFKKIK